MTVELPEVEGASTGAIGLAPYADQSEHTGPPEVIVIPDIYRPFFSTDARSVLVTMYAQHYNFIPNPAFRTDATGWEITGIQPASNAYSWSVLASNQAAGETAILAGTSSTSVEPNPVSEDPYVEGQIVRVVDDFTDYDVVKWRIIDGGSFRDWDLSLDTLTDEDKWVGQSVQCYGSGMLRYREGSGYVYVGPSDDYWASGKYAPKRSGPEWTFSVYVRGQGRVRLTMDAYYPEDREVQGSGPEYQNLSTVADPATEPAGDPAVLGPEGRVWTLIDPAPSEPPYYEDLDRPPAFASVTGNWETVGDEIDEWQRVTIRTEATVQENEGRIDFLAAWWIDAKIEVESDDGLLVSAVMLDPSESPECSYFDGSMTEDPNNDDFIWQGDTNDSVSLYYFDRMLRTKWLCERMSFVVPAGRPYQIFFDTYDRPYICSQESEQS